MSSEPPTPPPPPPPQGAHTLVTISAENTSSLVSGHTPPLASVDATTDMILHVACVSHRLSALIAPCTRLVMCLLCLHPRAVLPNFLRNVWT